ncbi:MAG: elongation factor G [Planctomycetota bacterium]|nr:elongation factor G [Planctomycetota bacterium]
MATLATADIRNLAIVGGAGSGKTTLVEALLAESGAIPTKGTVEAGNTQSGADALSKQFHTTVDATVVRFSHGGCTINLIDTPGAADFLGQAIGVLPAVEVALLVIDGVNGIQNVTRRMMSVCAQRDLPTMIIVNKIDAVEDEEIVLAAIQEEFGEICRPVDLPTGHGHGVVDCFENESGSSDIGDVKGFHDQMMDAVVEMDDAVMDDYLSGKKIDAARMHEPFERALRTRHIIPVAFVSARDGVGVAQLLADIVKLCPSPCEGNPRKFVIDHDDGRTESFSPSMKADDALVAHVFKIASDQYAGRMAFFKVHQGTLAHGAHVTIDDHSKPTRIPHVHHPAGHHLKEAHEVVAGDIGVITKVDETHFNATLHTEAHPAGLHLLALPFPRPMAGLAIEAATRSAEAKLGEALHKMTAEDPTFEVEHVTGTGELVIHGLGDLHLRSKIQMLKDRFSVEVESHQPKVAYTETIAGKAEGHHRHKKQSGGAGQFGEVYLRVEPLPGAMEGNAPALEFVDGTVGGSVPRQFFPAIEKGIKQVLGTGVFAGYPLRGVRVEIYDGKHHPVDSKEIAFIQAGKWAFIDAIMKAKPTLLEPFVSLEVTCPVASIGGLVGDLSGKRARVHGTDTLPSGQAIIRAVAPLSELMTYASSLKSMTGGSGSYTMELSHHEAAPASTQRELMAAFKPVLQEA